MNTNVSIVGFENGWGLQCNCRDYKGICDTPWCANYRPPQPVDQEAERLRFAKLQTLMQQSKPITATNFFVRWNVPGDAANRLSRPFASQSDAEVFAKHLVENRLATFAEVYTVLALFSKESAA